VIFKSPSAAEKAGYRACLRCRPDLAPGCKRLDAGKNIVSYALCLIEENASGNQSVEMLAQVLGLSARHLRRIFEEYLGASPIEIMQTQKLHLAKQLIQETDKPIGEIAYATGFNSIRRFNEVFKTTYKVPPSDFRKKKTKHAQQKDAILLKILVRKPYDFKSVLSFLKRHAAYGIEKVSNTYYKRYIPNKKSYSTLTVTMNSAQDALHLKLRGCELNQICKILVKIKRLFDVDHNPAHLPESIPSKQAGLRVPGSFDPFEVAVSIILSQLISIKQASRKLSELIQRFGTAINNKKIYAFPAPATLMNAEIETIGITKNKANAIRTLSAMVDAGTLQFSYSSDVLETRKCLLSIKGIGPWTTEMIMMRCFNDADAFPESDLIIKRALEQKLVDETLWQTNHSYLTHYIWNEFAFSLSNRKKL
jgi:AraC family transcriptional regulator of adaptative response / DNA-3-methyladenine glycosylase II